MQIKKVTQKGLQSSKLKTHWLPYKFIFVTKMYFYSVLYATKAYTVHILIFNLVT